MDYIKVRGLSRKEVIGLVKEWVKLYPHSFNPEVNFWFYENEDDSVIIGLHDDLSSLAVSLLVTYLNTAVAKADDPEPVVAFITVDDNEILLKQNYGRRAKIFVNKMSGEDVSIFILLENNYCVEYKFVGKAKKVKDSDMEFCEPDIAVGEDKEEVLVGDIIPKKVIEEIIEEESPLKKLMWYSICAVVGLAIGFLIVWLKFYR
ncbi:MAG: hypothetical protein ACI358_07870 [Candidatus Limimorpha sp.]